MMQELIRKYEEDIHLVAVPLVTELTNTFLALLEEGNHNEVHGNHNEVHGNRNNRGKIPQ